MSDGDGIEAGATDLNDTVQYCEPVDSLMASNSRAKNIYPCVTTESVAAKKVVKPGGGGDGYTRRGSSPRQRRLDDDDVDVASCMCRKWRPLPLSQTGFIMSLLPRQSTTLLEDSDVDEGGYRWSEIAAAFEDVQLVDSNSPQPNTSSSSMTCVVPSDIYRSKDAEVVDDNCSETSAEVEMWLECLQSYNDGADFDNETDSMHSWRQYGDVRIDEQTTNRPLRAKKKWRIEKARRQLKTPHCRSVSNCFHGVTLYVNHRVLKRMTMVMQPTSHRPCSVTLRQIDKEKALLIKQNGRLTRERRSAFGNRPTPRSQQASEVYSDSDLEELHDELSYLTATLLYAVDPCSADRSVD